MAHQQSIPQNHSTNWIGEGQSKVARVLALAKRMHPEVLERISRCWAGDPYDIEYLTNVSRLAEHISSYLCDVEENRRRCPKDVSYSEVSTASIDWYAVAQTARLLLDALAQRRVVQYWSDHNPDRSIVKWGRDLGLDACLNEELDSILSD